MAELERMTIGSVVSVLPYRATQVHKHEDPSDTVDVSHIELPRETILTASVS